MDETNELLENQLKFLKKVSKKPDNFLSSSEEVSENIKQNLKQLYDFSKKQEIKQKRCTALLQLLIKEFDIEQIWQQLELQNDFLLKNFIANVSELVAYKNKLLFSQLRQSLEQHDENKTVKSSDNENSEEEINSDCEDLKNVSLELEEDTGESSDNETDNDEEQPQSKRFKLSKVDDEFFKVEEMERFLEKEEATTKELDSGNDSGDDSDSDKESIDLFQEMDSSDEEGNGREARYKDFFVKSDQTKKEKRNKFLEDLASENSDSNEEMEKETKSSFELRANRLKEKIEDLEDAAVAEKQWQLKGEITATDRPANSLLEEVLEFDMTSRPAPVITEKTTLQLEDIIKLRIRDKAYDSVERKVKPSETPLEYKKKLVLDQEKSKLSLAQIYEKEYLDKQAELDPDSAEKEEEEPDLHKEIRKMMKTLFNQLDALSNYHFTPKPAIPELKIIRNMPAVTMEEVAPVALSDAALLAPEEVKGKAKGELLGESEKTATDKKRSRRKKKIKQKIHAELKRKRDEQKLQSGKAKIGASKNKELINRVTKDRNTHKMDQSVGNKGTKSSTAFFTQLQEQVQSQIKTKTTQNVKKKRNIVDAKRIKL